MPEIKVCFTLAAVHRYYESRRRAYNDAKPERAEVVRRNCMNSATANRKKRVCVIGMLAYASFANCFVTVGVLFSTLTAV